MLEAKINGSKVGISVLKQNNNELSIFVFTNSAFVKNAKNKRISRENIIKFLNFVIIIFSSS